MKGWGFYAVLSLALVLPGSGALAIEKLPRSLARLTPEAIQASVRVSEDPLDRFITLSTAKAWKRGSALQGAYASDVHLKILVDKDSGAVRWQVWHELEYSGGLRQFTKVAYHANGRLAEAPLTGIEHWTDYAIDGDGYGRDSRHARIVFELPDTVVRDIAASYNAGSRKPWRLRFMEETGQDVTSGLAPAEVAGLMRALQSWQGRSR